MDYFRPQSLEEAIGVLSEDEEARCLAGGQTLVAMMNARILAPTRIVSLRDLPDMDRIEARADGGLRIGSMVTHAALENFAAVGSHRLLPETARQIASPAVRAFGTIGGSLCHADPAADWPVALVALDAVVEIAGPNGVRSESAETFIVDALTTSLGPGEVVTHIAIPSAAADSVAAYLKLARVEGDFATASVAVTLAMAGEICDAVRLAVGGCAPVPVRAPQAEALLHRTSLTDDTLQAAGDVLAAAVQPEDDTRASAAYRRRVVPGLVKRAVQPALDRE